MKKIQTPPTSRQHQYYEWDSIDLIKKLSNRHRHQVFLAAMEDEKLYAIKVFPYRDKHYLSESSFLELAHENIIAPSFTGETSNCSHKKFSLIFYEYCMHRDLHHFMKKYNIIFTEKMTRTFFKQLVEAIEYLHEKNIVHHDLKPDNLFLGEDFKLKVGDFDLSYRVNKEIQIRGGTPDYFAPEEESQIPFDPYKSEYFTMGVVLFVLSTGCIATPYKYKEYNKMRYLLEKSPNEFWTYFQKVLEWPYDRWSPEFKDLFKNLTWKDPNMRYNLEQIKKSAWYKGEVYSPSEVKVIMEDYILQKQERIN